VIEGDSSAKTKIKKSFERVVFQKGVRFAIAFVFVLWTLKFLEEVTSTNLSFLGVYPRTLTGSIGIITGPLVHSDWLHLVSNSIPLIILIIALFYFFSRIAVSVFTLIYLITGFWVWIAARDAFHIGASGVVYGLISFLMLSGFIRKDIKLLALSFVIMILYGSQMVYGIFPLSEGVSWESHLLGMISGLFLAFYFKHNEPKKAESIRFPGPTGSQVIEESHFTYVNDFSFKIFIKKKDSPKGMASESKYSYDLPRKDSPKIG